MQTETAESFSIIRDGEAPLRFSGRIIGSAEETSDNNGLVRVVEIYRTTSGKFVARRFVDANFLERPERSAEAFDKASALITSLRDTEGTIDSVAQDSIDRAAKHDESIRAAYGVDVA